MSEDELKRLIRKIRRIRTHYTSIGLLEQAGEVRRSIAHAKKRWPDYEIPASVYRWWRLARQQRLHEKNRLPE